MSEETKEPDNTIMTGVGKDGELVTTDPNAEPEAEPEPEETPEKEEAASVDKVEKEPEAEADPEKEPVKEGDEEKDEAEKPEETTETDEETEEPEVVAAEEKVEKPKKKDRFQKRVDKLTHDKRILEEDNARLRAGQQPQPVAVQEVEETEPPKESDFKTYEEFEDAKDEYKFRKRYGEEKQKEADARVEARNQQIVSEHYQRIEVARENHDDWDEVAAQAQNLRVPDAVGALIYEHKAGPEILYHLTKNPEVAANLWQMSTVSAVAEVGKLAASLASNSSPAKQVQPPSESSEKSAKSVSNATPPIKPVGKRGAHKTKRSLDDPDLSPAEFSSRRDKGENFRPSR